MDARRLVAPLVTGLLVLAVGGGIWYSNTRLDKDREADAIALDTQRKQVSIRGLIGSEKGALIKRKWSMMQSVHCV